MQQPATLRLGWALWCIAAFGVAGCETTTEATHIPPRLLYTEAESLENQGLYSEATTKYEQVIAENPGTRLATFSYLKLAEIKSEQEEWLDAEANYRLFLTVNPDSHFTPYALYRLLKVNHERSYTGAIFKEREIDRDMAPNRQILLEYKRFYLLFPNSIYLEEVTPFYRSARQTLAEREVLVADFYFERRQFHAAIGRYRGLLKNYPEFKQIDLVLEKLIQAYRENNQPSQASDMERVLRQRAANSGNTAGRAGEPSARLQPHPGLETVAQVP